MTNQDHTLATVHRLLYLGLHRPKPVCPTMVGKVAHRGAMARQEEVLGSETKRAQLVIKLDHVHRLAIEAMDQQTTRPLPAALARHQLAATSLRRCAGVRRRPLCQLHDSSPLTRRSILRILRILRILYETPRTSQNSPEYT